MGAERAPAACEMFLDEVERKRVVAGRDRRVRREDGRLPDFLERLVEGRARARSGRGSAAARRTPHDLRSDGRRAGSMPSALSARTPPMPRMISCWMRVSRSPPYSRADSSRSQGAFSSRSVSRRYSFTRPIRTRQTATSTDRSPSGTAVTHGLPSGVSAGSIGASAQLRRS